MAPTSPTSGSPVLLAASGFEVTDTRLTQATAYTYSVFVVAPAGRVLGKTDVRATTTLSTTALAMDDVLYGGQSLASPSGQYRLNMQTDGNFVLEYASSHRLLWSTGTNGNPGASVQMQGDGNLVVYSAGGRALWNSGTSGHLLAHLDVQNDGNVVVYYSGGAKGLSGICTSLHLNESLWANQYVQSPSGRFVLIMQGDGNLVLYDTSAGSWRAIWATHTTGNNVCWMQSDGNLVVYRVGGGALWSSKTAGHAGAILYPQDDGNLVLYNGPALWASNTVQGAPVSGQYSAFINDARWANGTAWGYYQTPKQSTYGAIGCCAYVCDFCAYVFGKNSFNNCVSTFTSVGDIRAGDVLHIYNATYGEHWIAVLGRNGNTLSIAEGNCSSKVRIGNNYSIVGSGLSGSYSLTLGYHMQ